MAKKGINLVDEDKKVEGGISLKDYRDLFSFSIGSLGIFIFWSLAIIACLLQLVPSYVLATWSGMPLEE